MACHALKQANTLAVFGGPGGEHWPNLSVTAAAHAGELFLKAIIAKEHPLLIFRDLFSLDKSENRPLSVQDVIERGKTYNFESLPKLLWVVTGERLPDLDSFDRLRKTRNSIQHFCAPEIDDPQSLSLSFLYKNIDPLIKRHLKIDAIEIVEPDDQEYLLDRLISLELQFSTSEPIEGNENVIGESWAKASSTYRKSVGNSVVLRGR